MFARILCVCVVLIAGCAAHYSEPVAQARAARTVAVTVVDPAPQIAAAQTTLTASYRALDLFLDTQRLDGAAVAQLRTQLDRAAWYLAMARHARRTQDFRAAEDYAELATEVLDQVENGMDDWAVRE